METSELIPPTANPIAMIHTLPEEVLLMVFDWVPLLEMSNLVLTCQRWHSLRASILARRTQLTLGLNCHKDGLGHTLPRGDTLDLIAIWPVLSVDRVTLLADSFPEARVLRSLSVCYCTCDQVDKERPNNQQRLAISLTGVSVLLRLWSRWGREQSSSSVLRTVDLSFPIYDVTIDPVLGDQLLRALGGVTSLRVLRISFPLLQTFLEHLFVDVQEQKRNSSSNTGGEAAAASTVVAEHRQLLSRLECLHTDPESELELMGLCLWLGANLLQPPHHHHNHRLGVNLTLAGGFQLTGEHLDEWIYPSGAPLAQFTGWFPEPASELDYSPEQITEYLSRLTRVTQFSLTKNTTRLTFAQMTRALAQLPELRLLTIRGPVDGNGDDKGDDDHDYRPLASVRHLAIYLPKRVELMNERSWLRTDHPWRTRLPHGTVFPALERLSLRYKPSWKMLKDDSVTGRYWTDHQQMEEAAVLALVHRYAQPYYRGCRLLTSVGLYCPLCWGSRHILSHRPYEFTAERLRQHC